MLNDNVVSLREQNLNANSTQTKSVANYNLSSSLAIPLVTLAWLCVNAHHSALAVDLNSQIAENKLNYTGYNPVSIRDPWHQQDESSKAIAQPSNSGIVPRIVSLIADSWKQKPFDLLSIFTTPRKETNHDSFQGLGGTFPRDFGSLYLSRAQSTSSQEFWTGTKLVAMTTPQSEPLAVQPKLETYSVKAGDTINRIAQKFRVSRQELIALNKIKNSNIIFVNQRLKIPPDQISNSQSVNFGSIATKLPSNATTNRIASLPTPTYLADARLKPKNLAKVETTPTPISNEERITRLRTEIDQMRDQYRAEIKQQKSPALVPQSNSGNASSLPLLSTSARANTQLETANNQQPTTLQETAMAFNLPPLPAADEYLPDAFDGYAWPARGVLTSGYGWRWGRLHKGIDIAAPIGTPIFAAAGGKVISAGWNSGGYGNLVKLQHLDGSITLYAHNHRILVSSGQKVNKGEQIAEMGSTGFSTGSHLHFEIHTQNQGIVDPLALLSRK